MVMVRRRGGDMAMAGMRGGDREYTLDFSCKSIA